MSEYPIWLVGLGCIAMTMQTGGGAGTGRDVDARRDFVGRDQIYNADQGAWREFVARDLDELREELAAERQRATMMLILLVFLFLMGAFSTAFVLRQTDRNSVRMDRIEDRWEQFRAIPR
jgi:hypothetical protein